MGKQKKLIDVHFPVGYKGRFRGQFLPPKGALTSAATFPAMQDAGCTQATNEKLFLALMKATAANPCNGCPTWCESGHACGAFKLYHASWAKYQQEQIKAKSEHLAAITPHNVPDAHPLTGKNMKQIAATLGVSLSMARRLKLQGVLAQPDVVERVKAAAGTKTEETA